jgi:hypothetical protein
VLLPPDKEPEISLEELLSCHGDDLAILYYRRSGRIRYPDPDLDEEAEEVDLYCYVRPLLGGKLPWETGKGEPVRESNKPVIIRLNPDNTPYVKVAPGVLRKLTSNELSELLLRGNFAFVKRSIKDLQRWPGES